MNKKDLYIGAAVYHSVFHEWGKGTVKQVRGKNVYMRRKDNWRDIKAVKYLVEWENSQPDSTNWCVAIELRKTEKSSK